MGLGLGSCQDEASEELREMESMCKKHTCRPHVLPLCFPADINECETEGGDCAHGCHNTPGSYVCVCSAAYELGSDGKQCYSQCESCTAVGPSWMDDMMMLLLTHSLSYCALKELRWKL